MNGRPPLGLRPRYVVAALRVQEILEAMHRYASADTPIPPEWVTELVSLSAERRAKRSGATSPVGGSPVPPNHTTEAEALEKVRQHSGSAVFFSADGHRWTITSVREGTPARAEDGWESHVRADGILTLRYIRDTPTPDEYAAERLAASLVSSVLSVVRAPQRARDRVSPNDVRAWAKRIVEEMAFSRGPEEYC